MSDRDSWSHLKKPFHVRCYEILHSTQLGRATEIVTESERSCSANFLIAQATAPGRGEAIDIEAAPHATCRFAPREGLLAHANHFLTPDALGVYQPLMEDRQSTFHRCARMDELLHRYRAGGQKISRQNLKDTLRDHEEHPDSICRHPNAIFPPDERYATVFSVILDLPAREMHYTAGPPCESEYQKLSLS
jgi:isopenicillin-N N-acyltransferase-like protein